MQLNFNNYYRIIFLMLWDSYHFDYSQHLAFWKVGH